MNKKILAMLSLSVLMSGMAVGCKKKDKTTSSSVFSEIISYEGSGDKNSSSQGDNPVTPASQAYERYHDGMKGLEKANSSFCYEGTETYYSQTSVDGAKTLIDQLETGHYYKYDKTNGDTLQKYARGVKNSKTFESKYVRMENNSNYAYAGYEKDANGTTYYSYSYDDYETEKLTDISLLYKAYPIISSSNSLEEENKSVSEFLKGETDASYNFVITLDYKEADATLTVELTGEAADASYLYDEKMTFTSDQLTEFVSSSRVKKDSTYYTEEKDYTVTYGRPTSWSKVSLSDEQMTELKNEQMNASFIMLGSSGGETIISWEETHDLVTVATLDQIVAKKGNSNPNVKFYLIKNDMGEYSLAGEYNQENLSAYRSANAGKRVYISFSISESDE